MNWPLLLQMGASLVAVLMLGGLARLMGLGGDVRIRDDDHARQLADEGLYGFKATAVARDRAGYAALLRDVANRHALIIKSGAHFVVRPLFPPIEGRLDQSLLTLDLPEPGFQSVTLNLGPQAQYWVAGLRHIPHG